MKLAPLGCVLVVLCFTHLHRGTYAAVVVGFLASVCVLPTQLTKSGAMSYTGITQSTVQISTYTIAILAGTALTLILPHVKIRFLWAPLWVWFGFCTLFWPTTALVVAGIIHYALATLAWWLGHVFGTLQVRDEVIRKTIVQAAMVILALQACVSALQLLGFHLFPLQPDIAALMGSRTNGTLNHPNNVGKVALLLTLLVLPMTSDSDRSLRRPATVSMFLAAVVIAMSQGRANILGFLVVVVLHTALSRRHMTAAKRVAVLVIVAAIVTPFIPELMERFAEDPDGGARGRLTTTALQQIANGPWVGVGPNNYLDATSVGPFASRLPVHNSYLLMVSEIGYVGAIVFFIPLVVVTLRAWRRVRSADETSSFAVTLIAASVGLVPVVATGWGMIATFVLPLWMFVTAFLAAGVTERPDERPHSSGRVTLARVPQRSVSSGR